MQRIDLTIKAKSKTEFLRFASKHPDINTTHTLCGCTVDFLNGYGIPLRAEILGVCETNGDLFLDWDCYWFPINQNCKERMPVINNK